MVYEQNLNYNAVKRGLLVTGLLASYLTTSCGANNPISLTKYEGTPKVVLLAFQSGEGIDSIVENALEDAMEDGWDPEELKRLHGVELEAYGFRPHADLSRDLAFYVLMEEDFDENIEELELTIMLQNGLAGSPLEYDDIVELDADELEDFEFEINGDFAGYKLDSSIEKIADASKFIQAWTRGQYIVEIEYDSECGLSAKAVLYQPNSQYWIQGLPPARPTEKDKVQPTEDKPYREGGTEIAPEEATPGTPQPTDIGETPENEPFPTVDATPVPPYQTSTPGNNPTSTPGATTTPIWDR